MQSPLHYFVPNGMQKTAFSEEIDYRTDRNVTDEELIAMIGYAKEIGLNVALKPTANCADGTWRVHMTKKDRQTGSGQCLPPAKRENG